MHFEPIGEQVLVQLLPQNGVQSPLWTPSVEHLARQAVVVRGAQLEAGARIVIAMRHATQVGGEYLVPLAGVLAHIS